MSVPCLSFVDMHLCMYVLCSCSVFGKLRVSRGPVDVWGVSYQEGEEPDCRSKGIPALPRFIDETTSASSQSVRILVLTSGHRWLTWCSIANWVGISSHRGKAIILPTPVLFLWRKNRRDPDNPPLHGHRRVMFVFFQDDRHLSPRGDCITD